MNHFKGKQFQQDVIIVAVGYYLRYNLSYREVQEILYDRGINVSHTTIYRWVQEYGKLLYQIWKKKNKKSFYSWKMDETYIKIKGKWHYLYRAIDADGLTLDIWLRKKRDTQAAYAFLKRLVKQFDEPKVVVTDKAPSITSAFKKLKEYGFYQGTEHRTIKYLNNLIEQDHRPVKRRNKFYRSLRTASTTITCPWPMASIALNTTVGSSVFPQASSAAISSEAANTLPADSSSYADSGTCAISLDCSFTVSFPKASGNAARSAWYRDTPNTPRCIIRYRTTSALSPVRPWSFR